MSIATKLYAHHSCLLVCLRAICEAFWLLCLEVFSRYLPAFLRTEFRHFQGNLFPPSWKLCTWNDYCYRWSPLITGTMHLPPPAPNIFKLFQCSRMFSPIFSNISLFANVQCSRTFLFFRMSNILERFTFFDFRMSIVLERFSLFRMSNVLERFYFYECPMFSNVSLFECPRKT